MRMAIIKKYNKENGTTYVYDSVSYWDKEKQQPRSKRKLIGKIDPETGEIVPTAGRGRKPKQSGSAVPSTTRSGVGTALGNELRTDPQDADFHTLYETCRKQLQQKEAELARAESQLAALSREKRETAKQLEIILRQLRS